MQLLVPFLEHPERRLTSLRCINDQQQPTLIKVLPNTKQQSTGLNVEQIPDQLLSAGGLDTA